MPGVGDRRAAGKIRRRPKEAFQFAFGKSSESINSLRAHLCNLPFDQIVFYLPGYKNNCPFVLPGVMYLAIQIYTVTALNQNLSG
jgi:hypothetical protein